MIRFFIALWASKLFLFIQKLTGGGRSDKSGLLAARICPNILEYIRKPKLVIMVSGTNGKTTTTDLIAQSLIKNNINVQYNDWGANFVSGHIRCMLDCVNIFNKSIKEAAVIECDELISDQSLPKIKPDYLVITNLCKDSIRRNAYPDYVFNRLNEAIEKSPETVLILNAMDPISSNLGKNNKRIFVGVDDIFEKPYENITDDCPICFNCNHKLEYKYKNYRHLGKFKCSNCDYKNYEFDYVLTKINNDSMVVNNINYTLISNYIFNIYNELMIIALLDAMNISKNAIKFTMKSIKIPDNREKICDYKDYNIKMLVTKGQNGSACSSVFEMLGKSNDDKELILLFDERYGSLHAMETITWICDSDFEFLNKPNIKKIIVGGARFLDFKVRLLMAGIKEDKIVCMKDFTETYKYLSLNKKNNIYILNDVDRLSDAERVLSGIYERIDNNESN